MKVIRHIILILILIIGIHSAHAATLVVESKKQDYDDSKKLITLTKDVKVTIDDVNVRSPKAFLTINAEGKPDTATFVDGVNVIKMTKDSKSEVKASILKLSLINKEGEATGNVQSKMTEMGKPTVTIKSDYQSFNLDTNIMEAKNNVVMTYDDIKTNSDRAVIKITNKGGLEKLRILGNAKIIQEKVTVTGDEITLTTATEVLTANGNTHTVLVSDDTKVNIWGKYQQFNNKTNTAMASGSVKIIYNEFTATGPKAVLLPNPKTKKPNKIVFAGRSTITEGDKSIQADEIEITMNPKNFTAEGNVRTIINNLESLDSGNKGI
ncbi:MAG: hypothetical protein PHX18_03950 [Candidatus Gastranaerophilales bacterium]|nr:hypothetical protein [Candidatus Gastranaerophilales bacterium]